MPQRIGRTRGIALSGTAIEALGFVIPASGTIGTGADSP
jgi:hypothetical protein